MEDLRVMALHREAAASVGAAIGSGYLIADRLVLTAAHVAGPAGAGMLVTVGLGSRPLRSRTVWRASGTDGAGEPLDAALIEIVDEEYEPVTLPPVRWGRLVGRGPDVPCSAVGFPDSMVEANGTAEPEQVPATLLPLSRARRGMVDVVPASWPEPRPDRPSPWSGMSGAMVLADQGQLAVAVLVETAANFADRRLTAVPIALLVAEDGFRELVERHCGRPPWCEPVELADVLRPWYPPARAQSPIALLRPEYEVAPFHGRTEILDRLISWCETGDQVRGLLVNAAGGTGKTRLARRLAAHLHGRGWAVGELSDAAGSLAPVAGLACPLLLIIDYAESRAKSTAALLRHLAERPGQQPVRVLLLARSAGQWWEQLLLDHLVVSVLPEPPVTLGGLEFEPDPQDRMTALAEAIGEALRQVPGYADHRPLPAFRLPWDLPDAVAAHPLSLHIAVLASLLGGDGESAEQVLLRHERKYWNRLAGERSLGQPEIRDSVLTFSLLCGAHSRQQAWRTVALLPGLRSDAAEDTRRALAHWIATLYPPSDPLADYWGSLTPDWLFEHLVTATVQREPELLENLAHLDDNNAATCLTEAQLHRAITILTAAAAHSGEAAAVARRRLVELVAIHNGVFIPVACHVSATALDPRPLLMALEVLVRHPAATLQHLYQIRSYLPPAGGVVAEIGLGLQSRIVAELRASDDEDDRAKLAKELDLLSIYLANHGRVSEAAEASAESVELYRAMEAADSAPTDYVTALTNYATNLGRAGNLPESYRRASEVVELFDRDVPAMEYMTSLAAALNSIYVYHEANGETEQAYEAMSRAVRLQRAALEQGSDSLWPLKDLGELLTNEANCLAALGRRAEEIAVRIECVDIFRRFYQSQPGIYADAFQKRARSLAFLLLEEERHAEAASLLGEAGEALTRLWRTDPDKQLQLGLVLTLQAQELSLAQAPFASVVHVLERSCAILRDLFRHNPAISARHYLEILKSFLQGAQLVAADIDIAPYMADVGAVYDYLITRWEAAGEIDDDAMTVPNLAMYVSWLMAGADPAAAIRICERVERLAAPAAPSDAIDYAVFRPTLTMLRAKALAAVGDLSAATEAGSEAAERLSVRASAANHWPAFVAADGLLELAARLTQAGDLAASLRLSRAGSAICAPFVADAAPTFAPMLANLLIQSATTHSRRGEHDAAATLLAEALGHVRDLADHRSDPNDRFVAFDINERPPGPTAHASLDELLSRYIEELQQCDVPERLAAALVELVGLRRTRFVSEGGADRAMDYAWIAFQRARDLEQTSRDEEALAAARDVIEVLLEVEVTTDGARRTRAMILHESAIVLARGGAAAEALAAITASVADYRELADDAETSRELAASLGDMSTMLSAAGRADESFTASEAALQVWRRLAASGTPEDQRGLFITLHNRMLSLYQAGREEAALAMLAEYQAMLGIPGIAETLAGGREG